MFIVYGKYYGSPLHIQNPPWRRFIRQEMVAKEDSNTTTIVIPIHKRNSLQVNHEDMHTIQLHTQMALKIPPQTQKNYYTTAICIHKQRIPPPSDQQIITRSHLTYSNSTTFLWKPIISKACPFNTKLSSQKDGKQPPQPLISHPTILHLPYLTHYIQFTPSNITHNYENTSMALSLPRWAWSW